MSRLCFPFWSPSLLDRGSLWLIGSQTKVYFGQREFSRMIFLAIFTSCLPPHIKEPTQVGSIVVGNDQQCLCSPPRLGREPRMNDYESNALDIKFSRPVLKSIWHINTTWHRVPIAPPQAQCAPDKLLHSDDGLPCVRRRYCPLPYWTNVTNSTKFEAFGSQ